jgi:hypothetical protein
MRNMFHFVHSFQVIKHMGDPKLIIEYVNRLEDETKSLRKEVEEMKSNISLLNSTIDAKTSEIQCLQSVVRNGGY